jgi:hypothetical protein
MGAVSVVTIPLKTEKWQSDLLVKRFEICRQIYNSMLGYELKKLREMERKPEYKQAQDTIASAYKNMTKQERKKSKGVKSAIDAKKDLMKEYGFSDFGFTNDVGRFYKYFNANVSSMMAGRSIAKPMWAAFDDYFYGNGEKIKFKRKGDWHSIVTDGKSGIRIVDEEGNTVLGEANGRKLYCLCGTNKGKPAKMPLKIDKSDTYKLEMLDRKYKCVRITHKEVRGKLKWYVQITVDGTPAVRYDKDGVIKNPINEGKVGIYVDTSQVVYTTDGKTFTTISLEDTEKDIYYDTKIAEIQRYLDNSRRATNPENYNSDGTIKKGNMQDGKRYKLRWNLSKGYYKALAELKDLYRVQSENRKLERIVIANEILSHGNCIAVNDYPFQWAAMRKKETKSENERKKKAGYAVGHNAPAMLVTLIDAKLTSAGNCGVTKIKISDIDKSDGYRKFYTKQMYESIQ